jgi:transposase-like protein
MRRLAVSQRPQVLDHRPCPMGRKCAFLLSAKRDAAAAKRFLSKALGQPHTVNPRSITADKNPSYPKAVAEMKKDAELWRRSWLRQVKYLNNIAEQDHQRIKRLTGPGLGFGGFWTARRTRALKRWRRSGRGKFGTSVETTSRLRAASSPVCSRSPCDVTRFDHLC